MNNQITDAERTKREKAKNLRYRKAISKDINLETIQDELCDIVEECDNVRYYFETDDDTLLNALDGDSDEEYEFKMMFADLSAETEEMYRDLQLEYVPACFDVFFAAVSGRNDDLLGWDSFYGDYYGIGTSYEEELARKEAAKKICRMTKEQLIESAQICFKIFKSYIGIRHRYDCLKSAMDILKDENTGFLEVIKRIGEIYEKAEEESDGFRYSFCESIVEFDRLIECMPDMAWVQ